MRAVLGMLFLMGGFGVAYVVLSGKIPQLGTTPTNGNTPTVGVIPTAQNLQQTQAQMVNKQGAGGPMGIQLGPNGNDLTGTTGGYY